VQRPISKGSSFKHGYIVTDSLPGYRAIESSDLGVLGQNGAPEGRSLRRQCIRSRFSYTGIQRGYRGAGCARRDLGGRRAGVVVVVGQEGNSKDKMCNSQRPSRCISVAFPLHWFLFVGSKQISQQNKLTKMIVLLETQKTLIWIKITLKRSSVYLIIIISYFKAPRLSMKVLDFVCAETVKLCWHQGVLEHVVYYFTSGQLILFSEELVKYKGNYVIIINFDLIFCR